MTTINQDFANIVAKNLNSHGFGFQHGLAETLRNHGEARHRWTVQAEEFPVQVQGRDTRIDVILTKGFAAHGAGGPCGVVIGECKRANPALSNWVFFSTASRIGRQPIIESLCRGDSDVFSIARELAVNVNIFDLGLAIRSNEKGDGAVKLGSAIEDASTQVLRCVNGFVDFLGSSGQKLWEHRQIVHFLPVIFTTANLFTASTNFSDTDLATGNLMIEPEHLKSVDWLFCDFPVSLSLRHGMRRLRRAGTIPNARIEDFQRTVAIVNPAGLDDFVRELFWFELENMPSLK